MCVSWYIYIYQSFLRNHERKTIGHTDIYSLYFKVWLICASLYMGMYIYIYSIYICCIGGSYRFTISCQGSLCGSTWSIHAGLASYVFWHWFKAEVLWWSSRVAAACPITNVLCGSPGSPKWLDIIIYVGPENSINIYIYIYTILLGFSFHVCGKQIKEFSLTDWSPIQVFRIAWWMAHYSSPSPKRHLGLTNNVWADKLNKGKLTKEAREKLTLKPVDRTVSKSGKRGYKGNKLLKSTQSKP